MAGKKTKKTKSTTRTPKATPAKRARRKPTAKELRDSRLSPGEARSVGGTLSPNDVDTLEHLSGFRAGGDGCHVFRRTYLVAVKALGKQHLTVRCAGRNHWAITPRGETVLAAIHGTANAKAQLERDTKLIGDAACKVRNALTTDERRTLEDLRGWRPDGPGIYLFDPVHVRGSKGLSEKYLAVERDKDHWAITPRGESVLEYMCTMPKGDKPLTAQDALNTRLPETKPLDASELASLARTAAVSDAAMRAYANALHVDSDELQRIELALGLDSQWKQRVDAMRVRALYARGVAPTELPDTEPPGLGYFGTDTIAHIADRAKVTPTVVRNWLRGYAPKSFTEQQVLKGALQELHYDELADKARAWSRNQCPLPPHLDEHAADPNLASPIRWAVPREILEALGLSEQVPAIAAANEIKARLRNRDELRKALDEAREWAPQEIVTALHWDGHYKIGTVAQAIRERADTHKRTCDDLRASEAELGKMRAGERDPFPPGWAVGRDNFGMTVALALDSDGAWTTFCDRPGHARCPMPVNLALLAEYECGRKQSKDEAETLSTQSDLTENEIQSVAVEASVTRHDVRGYLNGALVEDAYERTCGALRKLGLYDKAKAQHERAQGKRDMSEYEVECVALRAQVYEAIVRNYLAGDLYEPTYKHIEKAAQELDLYARAHAQRNRALAAKDGKAAEPLYDLSGSEVNDVAAHGRVHERHVRDYLAGHAADGDGWFHVLNALRVLGLYDRAQAQRERALANTNLSGAEVERVSKHGWVSAICVQEYLDKKRDDNTSPQTVKALKELGLYERAQAQRQRAAATPLTPLVLREVESVAQQSGLTVEQVRTYLDGGPYSTSSGHVEAGAQRISWNMYERVQAQRSRALKAKAKTEPEQTSNLPRYALRGFRLLCIPAKVEFVDKDEKSLSCFSARDGVGYARFNLDEAAPEGARLVGVVPRPGLPYRVDTLWETK